MACGIISRSCNQKGVVTNDRKAHLQTEAGCTQHVS